MDRYNVHDELRSARLRIASKRRCGDTKLQLTFGGNSYDRQFTSISESKETLWADDCYQTAVNVAFTQMSAKKGIKKYSIWRAGHSGDVQRIQAAE